MLRNTPPKNLRLSLRELDDSSLLTSEGRNVEVEVERWRLGAVVKSHPVGHIRSHRIDSNTSRVTRLTCSQSRHEFVVTETTAAVAPVGSGTHAVT